MKVYIVEQGEYSDRTIIAVFLDKAKADNYAKYHNDGWGAAYVSEYETDDETYECVEKGWIRFEYVLYFQVDEKDIEVYFYPPDRWENPYAEKCPSSTSVNMSYGGKGFSIDLFRSYEEGSFSSYEEIKERMKKIAYDIKAQLLYEYSISKDCKAVAEAFNKAKREESEYD